jgi:anti-sigma28 factor (negative regulator of flagellin synthesis)
MNSQKESSKILKQLNAVRQRKIQKLRNQITAGKYRISNIELLKALFMAR